MWLDMLTLSLGGTDFDEFAWINRAANDNEPDEPMDYYDGYDLVEDMDAGDSANIMDVFTFMTRG
jgi:hypothetical protein